MRFDIDSALDLESSEQDDRLKIVIPIRRNWALLALYSLVLIVWLAMLIVVVSFVIRGQSFGPVHAGILAIWTLVWLVFGRLIWRRWQLAVATREILFIDDRSLVIRRPVSILGQTIHYDRDFVGPFYYSARHNCPAFDYAYLHVYFGQSLDRRKATRLVAALNRRYFPDSVEEDSG